jgi:hypothetical protein
MAQDTKRKNADFIKYGDDVIGGTRDQRVDTAGAVAKLRNDARQALNRVDPTIVQKPNKRITSKVSAAQAAQAMSGTSYSKLLKVK